MHLIQKRQVEEVHLGLGAEGGEAFAWPLLLSLGPATGKLSHAQVTFTLMIESSIVPEKPR